MAVSQKPFFLALGTSSAAAYTVPASTTARLTMIQIANVDGANDADVTVMVTDSSGATSYHLAYQVTVAAKDSLSVVAGGLILEAGDSINALASAAGDLELVGSVQEIS